MAAKIIAMASLLGLTFAASVAQYWFVYGLWPHSWMAYFFWTAITMVLAGLVQAVV